MTDVPSGRPRGSSRPRGVLLLTLRDLQLRATRFLAAILGTAVVFTLLFVLTGLTEQFEQEPRLTVEATGADNWLVPDGSTGPFTSGATLPAEVAEEVVGATAVPLLTGRHSIRDDEQRTEVVIIGYEPGQMGTPSVTAGRLPETSGEIVVDQYADVGVGDAAVLGPSTYTVVGQARRATLLGGVPIVFMHLTDAQGLMYRGEPLASALLLSEEVEPPAGYAVVSSEEVVADTRRPLDGAVSAMNLIRFLLWFVAAMIIGTLVYLSALDRRRDVAVLKAVGSGTAPLALSIALQGVLVALAAVAAASGLQALLTPTFPLPVVVPGEAFWQLPLVAVLVAVVAGAAGLRKAVTTDPAAAFAGAER